jgi:hypothetical protein
MSAPSTVATEWRPLGKVDPKGLADSRLQLHHAAQIIVSAGISYLAPKADDSHTNLEWLPDLRALATNLLPSPGRLRFALRPDDLTLLSITGGTVRSQFPLDGRPPAEALQWLVAELTLDGFPPERLTTKKHYQIPHHTVADGAAYRVEDVSRFRHLSDVYHDTWVVTSAVQSRTPGASDPRCWPHHFDLATLVTLQPAGDGKIRTIGVGMSPGDDSYTEPYFYVTPYPYPPSDALMPLRFGHWHTVGWIGAVLTVSELVEKAKGADQQERAMSYVDAAVIACRTALSGT